MIHRFSVIFRRVLALFCIAAALVNVYPAQGESALSEEEISTIFRRWKTVGGMVVVAKDGEIVCEYCYGYADQRNEDPVTADTYFKIASVSKLVTAVPVMRLVEAGRLRLDENIGHILGNPPYEAASPFYPDVSVTVRKLMSHIAGINDTSHAFVAREPLSSVLNPEENKSRFGFIKDHKPGAKYAYSNVGAGILGCILEAVTGKQLTDAVRELVFDPMGIDAAYDAHLLQYPEKIVTTYQADGNVQKTRSYRLNREIYNDQTDPERDYMISYGKLWIKGRDLCRIGMLLCDLGVIDGQRLLNRRTVRQMLSSQAGWGDITVDSPYGLNVERNRTLLPNQPQKIIYGHQGLDDGILCNLYFDPDTRFVFALVTNGCNTKAKQNRICTMSREMFTLMWNAYAGE